MNLIIFFIFAAIGIYIFLRFTKKGKQLHILQSPRELLLTTHEEINEELNAFVSKHDFSVYTPNVGVFGENSTGKSTFLNAMLGTKDEFKMGFGETTNKITVLYKHEKPVPVGGKGFAYLRSNKNYEKRDYRHLDYMNLFDIPGFGQQFSHDELTKVIKEMDVIFWFIDASKGVKKDDKLFLENIKGLDTKVIIVLNKIDAISENDEIENLLKEINTEISKIKTFFKDENVMENLVTVFPFSATKSLVGTVKGERGAFKVIDKVLENVLLYTVFIESYRGYIDSVIEDDEKFTIAKVTYDDDVYAYIESTRNSLEYELKENISFGSSINPFSSKDAEANPIVSKYLSILETRLHNCNETFAYNINEIIEKKMNNISSFEVFGEAEVFDFEIEESVSLDINIDLDSMAWDSFWGDGFSEKVADKFEKKVTKKVERQLPRMLSQYDNDIAVFEENLKNNAKGYANKLDNKLSKTTEKIQEPLLTLLLKELKGTLEKEDNIYIEKMLKLN